MYARCKPLGQENGAISCRARTAIVSDHGRCGHRISRVQYLLTVLGMPISLAYGAEQVLAIWSGGEVLVGLDAT